MSVETVRLDQPVRRRARAAGLVSTSAVATALVVGLADSVGEREGLARLDPQVAADVLRLRSPGLTAVAQAFTFAGSELVVGALAVVVLAVLLARRHVGRAAVFAVGMGGSAFLTVAVKLAVARPRPEAADRLGPSDSTFSFPSGHTLNSLVFLALLVWVLWTVASRWRTVLAAVAGVIAAGVGASRVYLGYHWTTDVLASALVGTAWLCLVWLAAVPLRTLVSRLGLRA